MCGSIIKGFQVPSRAGLVEIRNHLRDGLKQELCKHLKHKTSESLLETVRRLEDRENRIKEEKKGEKNKQAKTHIAGSLPNPLRYIISQHVYTKKLPRITKLAVDQ